MSATFSPVPEPSAVTAQPADARVCTCCVMDTTDPDITFDAVDACNHCHDYVSLFAPRSLAELLRRCAGKG